MEQITIWCWRQCTRVTFGIQAARSILQKTAANNFNEGVMICALLAIIITMRSMILILTSFFWTSFSYPLSQSLHCWASDCCWPKLRPSKIITISNHKWCTHLHHRSNSHNLYILESLLPLLLALIVALLRKGLLDSNDRMARAVLYQPEHNCAVKGTKAPYFLDCTLFGEQTLALPHFDKHTHFKYCHRVLMGPTRAPERRGSEEDLCEGAETTLAVQCTSTTRSTLPNPRNNG